VKHSDANMVLVHADEAELVIEVAGHDSGVGQLETVAVERTVTVTCGMDEQVDGVSPEAGLLVGSVCREELTRRGCGAGR
jgi:hypothetical protein